MNLESIFERVGKLPLTPFEKVLEFYRLSIEVERSKEPEIKNFYPYVMHYKSRSLLLVDLPCNEEFCDAYWKNLLDERFPLDLYIGMMVRQGDVNYPLFCFTIDFIDLENFKPNEELLPIQIENFEINRKVALKMGLTEDQIDTLNKGFHRGVSIDDVEEMLKNELGKRVSLQKSLYLALTPKAIDLSQLYSELSSERWKHTAADSELLKALLTFAPLSETHSVSITENTMLRVTELDDSQAHSVISALTNPVSVITGPPGTGKTQVIQNIMANAVALGKTVLVASKNNKAVDNVKERFDLLDSYGYLLRFGSKEQIRNNSVPSMRKLSDTINNLQKNNIGYLPQIILEYRSKVAEIISSSKKLNRLVELLELEKTINNKLSENKRHYNDVEYDFLTETNTFYNNNLNLAICNNIPLDVVAKFKKDIVSLKNHIEIECSGFLGWLRRVFSWKKFKYEVISFYDKLPGMMRKTDSFSSLGSRLVKTKNISEIKAICESIYKELHNLYNYLDKRLRIINDYQKKLTIITEEKDSLLQQKESFINELESLSGEEIEIKMLIFRNKNWIKQNSIAILEVGIECYLIDNNNGYEYVTQYINHILEDNSWLDMDYERFIKDTINVLKVLRLISVTNLSVKNILPLSAGLVDILIIDEASQCDVASALPLIARAKQIVVIGDPMQLRHISAITDEEEKKIKDYLKLGVKSPAAFNKTSLWDFCNNYIGSTFQHKRAFTQLIHHYRCHPDIIGYSNRKFYQSILKVDTNLSGLKASQKGLFLISIQGEQKNPEINVNEIEARKCIDVAIWLIQNNANDISIGIVTPFRHQAQRIYKLLPDELKKRIEVNTVHKYQGDEKDIIVYSTMVSTGSPRSKLNWIESNPNLVNVAVTRAKSALYVVCDANFIIAKSSSSNNPLCNLVFSLHKNNR